ncbi:MAG TPA: hypothetical protein VJ625_09905, partial [Propionibacteriaceae bacterium]|nr:hypothetical protein [Propionibacteriaceae bacterium]
VTSAISVNVFPCQFGHVIGAHPWRGDLPDQRVFLEVLSASRRLFSRLLTGDAGKLRPRRT